MKYATNPMMFSSSTRHGRYQFQKIRSRKLKPYNNGKNFKRRKLKISNKV